MFVHNDKISDRQFRRLLTLELFGVTTVLLPGILCETVRRDGVTALLGGMLLVLLFGLVLRMIARCSGKSLQQTLQKRDRILYELFLFVMLVQMILMGIWVLTLAAEMSRDILLQGSSLTTVLVIFAVVSLLGAVKGMESRARMAEVLYWFCILPFLVLLAFAATRVNPDALSPVLTEPVKTIAGGSYEVFIVFQGIMLGFFGLPYMKNRKCFWKNVRYSVVVNTVFCLILLFVAVGIFGIRSAAGQKWLALNLMTTPEFPGGLVERMDVLMVTIWMVALFFFVSGCMFHGGKMAERLLGMKRKQIAIPAVGIFITLGALVMGNREYSYYVYLNYMKYIGVPLMGVVLFFILWKLRPVRAIQLLACLVTVVCLTGCAGSVELEDREFVLALGVDWNGEQVEFCYDTSGVESGTGKEGDSLSGKESKEGEKTGIAAMKADHFHDMQKAYGRQSDKFLDYNHLKVIIIGKNLASQPEKLVEFLRYVEKNELFARNTKLFFTDMALEDCFAMAGGLDYPLGEYLENIYADSNYYVEEESTSVGDLINHSYEPEETLLVPFLEKETEKPVVGAYAVVRGVQWVDRLTEEEAQLVFLANGISIPMDVLVKERYAVELEHVSREVIFQKRTPLTATIQLKVRGRILNETVSEQQKLETGRELETILEQRIRVCLLERKELDLLHLYRTSAGHDRDLWLEYKDKRAAFLQNLRPDVNIQASIT